jgi:hemolysin activation/secretion protein
MESKQQVGNSETCGKVSRWENWANVASTVSTWSPYLLTLLVSSTQSAWAQSINPVTPPPPDQTPPTPLPPVPPSLKLPPQAPPTPEERLNVPGSIIVRRFEFVGNTALKPEELNPAIADFIGKPLTFSQLLQAANQITALYVQKGYVTSGAYIPSQEFRSGTIRIQIVEGSLEDIKVTVSKGRLRSDYVRSRVALGTDKPLNLNRLQSSLQQLQLNPLIERLDAELTAGTRPGVNSLAVNVAGAKTFNAQLNLNNNRNPSIGSFERGITVTEANLTGGGDQLSLSYSNTAGSNRFEGSYTIPVNPRNGTVGVNYRITNNKIVEPPFKDLDIKVNSREYELTFRQPVIQRATPQVTQELALSVTAARRESDSSILGVDFPLFPGADARGKTRINELRLTQEWLRRSQQDVLAARSDFNFGMGGTQSNGNEPSSRFFVWQGQFLYSRRLGTPTGTPAIGSTFLLRSNVQLTGDSLLSIKQFSLGGQGTVRGYRQDALLTDNGVSTSAEVRLPIARFPRVQGTLQLAPFVDVGTGWNSRSANPDPKTLIGAGLGLVWQMGDKLTARFDWGIPLVNANRGDRSLQEKGLYFQLEYKGF